MTHQEHIAKLTIWEAYSFKTHGIYDLILSSTILLESGLMYENYPNRFTEYTDPLAFYLNI